MHRYAFCLIAAVGLLAAAPEASASTVRQLSLRELVTTSDMIVHGTVVAASVEVDPVSGPWTLYTLDSAVAVKGKLADSRFSFRCAGGVNGTEVTSVVGTPSFNVNDEVIVFYNESDELCQVSGWFQGVLRVHQAPDGKRVVTDHDGLSVVSMGADSLVRGKRPEWVRLKGKHGGTVHTYSSDGNGASRVVLLKSEGDKLVEVAQGPEHSAAGGLPVELAPLIAELKAFAASVSPNAAAKPASRGTTQAIGMRRSNATVRR